MAKVGAFKEIKKCHSRWLLSDAATEDAYFYHISVYLTQGAFVYQYKWLQSGQKVSPKRTGLNTVCEFVYNNTHGSSVVL